MVKIVCCCICNKTDLVRFNKIIQWQGKRKRNRGNMHCEKQGGVEFHEYVNGFELFAVGTAFEQLKEKEWEATLIVYF